MSGVMNRFIGYFFIFILGFSTMILAEDNAIDCIVEPSISAELSTSVSGVLHEILVEKGAAVKKGQMTDFFKKKGIKDFRACTVM